MSGRRRKAFWLKVNIGNAGDCWEWKGAKTEQGYGQFCVAGQPYGAHRIAFGLTHPDFDEDLNVLHTCDNEPCCNPVHLHQGTHAQNIWDAWNKQSSQRPSE